MQTDRRMRHGFTLIELLTVIAIIGILAGLTAVGLTKAIQSAKMSDMLSRMRNVESLLYVYYTDNGTFPPGYGFVHPDVRDERIDCLLDDDTTNDATPRQDPTCLNPDNTAPPNAEDLPRYHFFLGSYMELLEQANNRDLYDPWSESYDTDGDGRISYLEYAPLRDRADWDDADLNDDVLYEDGTLGAANKTQEVRDLLSAGQRPFIYIPVNRRQADRIGKWYLDNIPPNQFPDEAGDPTQVNVILQDLATPIQPPDPDARPAEIPPTRYDGFILMSVGPQNNTAGLLRELTNMVDLSNYPENFRYHVLGHLLYYLATRDADNNGKLDFTYDGRRDLSQSEILYRMPDPNLPNHPGPPVLVSSK